MPDLVHETDYRVLGGSTWSGTEVIGRDELEQVHEINRYNLVRPVGLGVVAIAGVVDIVYSASTWCEICEGCASTMCGSTTGKRIGWRRASLSPGDVAYVLSSFLSGGVDAAADVPSPNFLFTTFHNDASSTSSTSALSALLFSRLITAFALFVATRAFRTASSTSSPSPSNLRAFIRG
ncbi:hypothetical protein OF846_002590 [Rhodotorula toruloides]|nr:hypothetical protein OF846_002590 [Rhodotorula toruloides]